MASRSSIIHNSLQRSKTIMGIESSAFGGIVFAGSFIVVAKSYWALPILALIYFLARWLTKADGQFMKLFFRYLDEGHVYDATPRPSDYQKRAVGWGKGVPL